MVATIEGLGLLVVELWLEGFGLRLLGPKKTQLQFQ